MAVEVPEDFVFVCSLDEKDVMSVKNIERIGVYNEFVALCPNAESEKNNILVMGSFVEFLENYKSPDRLSASEFRRCILKTDSDFYDFIGKVYLAYIMR